MREERSLPPGQYALATFPRFGLRQFAHRWPAEPVHIQVRVDGDVAQPFTMTQEFSDLPSVEQVTDFHCVTTWSHQGLRWRGVRFVDFYTHLVQPRARPDPIATFVIMRCQDGYAASLPLADLLHPSVLLATHLAGQPLPLEHGAPLRLVAPAHYGYKNPKHVCGIEFWRDARHYRPASFRFMDHPRARVVVEERGRWFPGWLLRYLYRPLVRPTIRQFHRILTPRRL